MSVTYLHDPRDTADAIPHNLEAEHAVLGILLIDPEAFQHIEGVVESRHFYEPTHGRMFAVMAEQYAKSGSVNPVAFIERFKTDPEVIRFGGTEFIGNLMAAAPAPSMGPEYAKIVSDLATRRDILRVCAEAGARARHDMEAGAFDILAGMESAAADVAQGGTAGSAWLTAGNVTRQALEAARNARGNMGLSTGLSELDDAMGGLRKGQLVIIAGRPAMGKSTAGLQIAKGVARKGRAVIFFSLEMPEFDLGLRMACDVAHDPLAPRYMGKSTNPMYFDAARGHLTEEQWWKLDQAREDIERWPLSFDVRPGLTVSAMTALARRKLRAYARQGVEPGCIIVDHLTIARAEQDRRGNKVAEVGDISRGLAEMAKHLDIPVVALCQLSRDVEKRGTTDKRPTLSDLRWSGEIEQDARVVMMLYRPEYYCRPPEDRNDIEAESKYRDDLEKVRNKLLWLIEKNNNGPTGQVETYCDIGCSAVRDRLGGSR
jgi:replicative DNA helicase